MKILYVDESGTVNSSTFYIVVGIVISSEQKLLIENILNHQITKTGHNNFKDIEIHANEIFSGRGSFWRKIDKKTRIQFIKDCITEVFRETELDIFEYCILNSNSQHIIKSMLEIINEFNNHLKLTKENGLVISDKIIREHEVQLIIYNTPYSNIVEVPLFLDSKKSRMLQFVDLIAYALQRSLIENDTQFIELIPKYKNDDIHYN